MTFEPLLCKNGIRLQLPSVSYEEAILQAGRLLVGCGYVNQPYIATMFEREEQVSTFIGQGTAIPHGVRHDPELVKKSGIVVLQYPEGIMYDNHICYLVIGIASTTDDHLAILQHISKRLKINEVATTLWTTSKVEDVYKIFLEEESL